MTSGSARALLRRFGTFMDTFSTCFSRAPQRAAATQYLEGLFNDSERKSMQAMHGRLSDPVTYQSLQHFITHSPWDAARVWTQLRALVPVRAGILALDDTGFPKQGRHSVGVKRQYCGALGKVGNCQVAVSSVLIADERTWPLTFELYLPDDWMTDPDRRAAAGIPDALRFREKWRIALAHVRTVLQAGFQLDGVTVDADYGSNAAFRRGLERLGLRYGVAIRGTLTMWTAEAGRAHSAATLADAVPAQHWIPVTWGTGTKGPLRGHFLALRVRPTKARGERWLLAERSDDEAGRKYYLLNLAPDAPLHALVALVRSRWPIEQQYRELKDELGVDHFEGRTYRGWTHHTVLAAVAFTFLQLERGRGDPPEAVPRPTLPHVRLWVREVMAVLYIIHTRKLLNLIDNFRRDPPLRR
jgi:SRSO17 transposase